MRVELLVLPGASVVAAPQPWSWNTAPNTAARARSVFVNCIAGTSTQRARERLP